MPTIEKLVTGTPPVLMSAQASALEAADAMKQHHVGSVLIVDGDGKARGIFTERDLMVRVVAARRDPGATPLGEVMTRDMFTASPGRTIADVRAQLQARHIRHVPIITEDGRILGTLSLRDLLRHDLDETSQQVRQLTNYIKGDAAV